jgi:hypothetical protein
MFKTLTKSRSANFYSTQVKVLLLVVIGVLIANSPDTRSMIADGLDWTSEQIRPTPTAKSFLNDLLN